MTEEEEEDGTSTLFGLGLVEKHLNDLSTSMFKNRIKISYIYPSVRATNTDRGALASAQG